MTENARIQPALERDSFHRPPWRNVLFEICGYSIIGGCVALMLVFLIGILLVGRVVLYEPSQTILFVEIVLVCFGLMFLLKKISGVR